MGTSYASYGAQKMYAFLLLLHCKRVKSRKIPPMFKKSCYFLIILFIGIMARASDVILEFKAAYFLPTHRVFKDVFGSGALCGPELTFQLCKSKWHGFVSLDYLKNNGCSLGIGDKPTVQLLPLGFGLKYLFPTETKCVDVYVGLGLQSMFMRIEDGIPFIGQNMSQWGFGGIAKTGLFWFLPKNIVIDFFAAYSFVHMFHATDYSSYMNDIFLDPRVGGALFGIGLGYHF